MSAVSQSCGFTSHLHLWVSSEGCLGSPLETRWEVRSGERKSRAGSSQMRWFENPPRHHPGEVFQTCPNGGGGLCCGPRTRWEIRSLGCLVNTSLSPQTSWKRRLGRARSRLFGLTVAPAAWTVAILDSLNALKHSERWIQVTKYVILDTTYEFIKTQPSYQKVPLPIFYMQ